MPQTIREMFDRALASDCFCSFGKDNGAEFPAAFRLVSEVRRSTGGRLESRLLETSKVRQETEPPESPAREVEPLFVTRLKQLEQTRLLASVVQRRGATGVG